jgi:hypothetical protein
MSEVTAQQIVEITQMFNDLKQRLLPAQLKNVHSNGYLISSGVKKRGLPFTVESALKVVNELLFTGQLEWDIEPAKLQAQKNANPNAPLTEKTAWKEKLESEATRIANTKTVEQAAAKKKTDDASIKQSRDLISGYNPIKKGRYDAAEREEMQKKWTAALEKEIANKGNLQTFAQALSAVIQKRYDDREKASERL